MIRSLQCDPERGSKYTSSTQIARVVSEHWCSENPYCAACEADRLDQATANTKALDFRCSNCRETYQIKSQKSLNLRRIVDGAYSTMMTAVQTNVAPNLVILNYSPKWTIQNLVLVPSLFFTESVLEKRVPLSPAARRAGWVGCNILLSNVPVDGKIAMVQSGMIIPPRSVRETYKRYQQFESLDWNVRGWTLDVLRVARKIGTFEFSLSQVYRYEEELAALHPQNRNIRAKIRQQLQVLRDLNIVEFIGSGRYRFMRAPLTPSPQGGIIEPTA
jgi:type II restriction enzyme